MLSIDFLPGDTLWLMAGAPPKHERHIQQLLQDAAVAWPANGVRPREPLPALRTPLWDGHDHGSTP